MKKKIGLFLGAKSSGGGTFQYCQTVLHAIAKFPKEEFDIFILYTNNEWEQRLINFSFERREIRVSLLEKIISKTIKKISLPVSIERKLHPLYHSIAKNIIKSKCDIWIFPSPEEWAYLTPVTSIVSIYDLMHRYEKQFPEVSANGVYESRENLYINISKYSKFLLVDSEIGKKQFIESYGFKSERIFVLPFIPPDYIYSQKTPIDFDSKYKDLGKFIFYPAQFWKHKNHKNFIFAANNLTDKFPDLKIIFVGHKKNGYLDAFNLSKKLGLSNNIKFLEYLSDAELVEFYKRARGLIMPTFFGPTNIPPLEANALGCPVAVSNIYGMPKQLGNAAIYFDPSSVNEIEKTICEIWTNDELCQKLTENGFKKSKTWNSDHFEKEIKVIILNSMIDNFII